MGCRDRIVLIGFIVLIRPIVENGSLTNTNSKLIKYRISGLIRLMIVCSVRLDRIEFDQINKNA